MGIIKKISKPRSEPASGIWVENDEISSISDLSYMGKVPLESICENEYAGISVLIADDDGDQREILGSFFKRYGAQTDYAENGEQALNLYLADPYKYDIILMDMQMPVMSGRDAAEAIRKSGAESARNVYIAATSGSCLGRQDDSRIFDARLGKPFSLEQLAYIVKARK